MAFSYLCMCFLASPGSPSSHASLLEPLHVLRGGPRRTLFGATLGFFAGFSAVSLFGPAAGRFQEALGLTPLKVSWLVASPSLSGSLLRIPFAAWVDSTGGKRPFVLLLGMSILGMVGLLAVLEWLPFLRSTRLTYAALFGLGVLVGCGIAAFSVGIGQVSYWFPQRKQGRVLAMFAGAGNLAPGLVALVLPYSLREEGLRGTYMIWLLALVATTALYCLLARDAPYFQLRKQLSSKAEARAAAADTYGQELFPREDSAASLRLAAASRRTWALVVVYFTTFGGLVALTSWLPVYWAEFHGIEATRAGRLTALYSISASLIRIVGGGLSDVLGGLRTLICALLVTAAGAATLSVAEVFKHALAGQMLLALGMGIANAAVFKLVPQEIPEAIGGATGWVSGLGAFGGFAIPPAMAAFVARDGLDGYPLGFVIFIGLSFLSLIVAACALRRADAGKAGVNGHT